MSVTLNSEFSFDLTFAGTKRIAIHIGNGMGTSSLNILFGDHLATTSRSANYDGASTALQLYKAWGESRYASGTLLTSFKFTGQRLESSLGIYDFGERWYNHEGERCKPGKL